VLEDAQAMDEASASLLRRVIFETDALPLLVVLTRGPETPLDLPEGSDRLVIELEPLGRRWLSAWPGPGAARCWRPLRLPHRRQGERQPDVPPRVASCRWASGQRRGSTESLEPLLATQIDLLSPSDRQVLRAAAVLGTHFSPGLLHELLEDGVIVDSTVWDRLGAYIAQLPSVGDSLTV